LRKLRIKVHTRRKKYSGGAAVVADMASQYRIRRKNRRAMREILDGSFAR
jgi:hypothetical protein